MNTDPTEPTKLLLALGLHFGAEFLRLIAGAADLVCKVATHQPFC